MRCPQRPPLCQTSGVVPAAGPLTAPDLEQLPALQLAQDQLQEVGVQVVHGRAADRLRLRSGELLRLSADVVRVDVTSCADVTHRRRAVHIGRRIAAISGG